MIKHPGEKEQVEKLSVMFGKTTRTQRAKNKDSFNALISTLYME